MLGDRVVTAVLERPVAYSYSRNVEQEAEVKKEKHTPSQGERIAELAYRVRVGEEKLVDMSRMTGEEALAHILGR